MGIVKLVPSNFAVEALGIKTVSPSALLIVYEFAGLVKLRSNATIAVAKFEEVMGASKTIRHIDGAPVETPPCVETGEWFCRLNQLPSRPLNPQSQYRENHFARQSIGEPR